MRTQRFSLSNPRLKAYILIEYFFSNHLTIQNNHDSCPSILSLINFKTSGFALCINSLGPKLAIPSILKYLVKPLNALAFFTNSELSASSITIFDFTDFSYSFYFFWTGYFNFWFTFRFPSGLFLNPSISSISLISLLVYLFTST